VDERKKDARKIQTAEIKFLTIVKGYTRSAKTKSEHIWEVLGVYS
jgi:hypothetical protein